MTPEITRTFDRLKREHGPGAVARVEAMMQAGRQDRDRAAGAKYIMPGISKRPWHDPYEHAALGRWCASSRRATPRSSGSSNSCGPRARGASTTISTT